MLGFSPLASAPLADDGLVKVELTAVSISTQATSVANVNFTQEHSLTNTELSAGTPTVGSTVPTQEHSLTTVGISTGTPSVGTSSLSEDYSINTSDISTGTPTIGSTDLDEFHALTPNTVSSETPSADSVDLTQVHSFTSTGVTSQNPVVDILSVSQVHTVSTTDISTGVPVVDNTTSTQNFTLTPSSVSTGTTVVANTTISQVSVFNTSDLSTSAPTVEATGITQVHSVSLNDTTSGNPVTDSPDLDETQSLTPLGITAGSPTLDSPVFSAFDLQLSANGVTAGTPDLGDQRLAGYDNARNNFFNGTVSHKSTVLETSSSYYYGNFWSAVPSSSINENSSRIEFQGYIEKVFSSSSVWMYCYVRLYKSGSTPASIAPTFNSYTGSGNPPAAGTSGHVGLDDIVTGTSPMSWMEDSASHATTDSTAFPVNIASSGNQLELQQKSGSGVYDTYTIPNWLSGTVAGFSFNVDKWRLNVASTYTGNFYTAWPYVYSFRFNPPQPFTTNDATLTHLLTGVGLLGFDAGTPTVGDAGLTVNHNLAPVDVASEIPTVDSSSIEQHHVLSPNNLNGQTHLVDNTGLNQDHSIQADSLSTQTHVVNDCDLSQNESLSADDVSSGNPVVDVIQLSQHFENLPVGFISGVPDVGTPLYQRNEPVDSVVSGVPDIGSTDLTETTLSVSPVSVSADPPDLGVVVLLQRQALIAQDIVSGLVDVGQTSFVFKGKVGALNSVTVNLSKNSVTVNLSKNSVG